MTVMWLAIACAVLWGLGAILTCAVMVEGDPPKKIPDYLQLILLGSFWFAMVAAAVLYLLVCKPAIAVWYAWKQADTLKRIQWSIIAFMPVTAVIAYALAEFCKVMGWAY